MKKAYTKPQMQVFPIANIQLLLTASQQKNPGMTRAASRGAGIDGTGINDEYYGEEEEFE